jgi:Domain of unknown function (DUF4382)
MRRFLYSDVLRSDFPGVLLVCSVLCLLFAGCNTCIGIVSNPGGSGGVVTVTNLSTCSLPAVKGNLRPHINLSPALAATPSTMRHIFVTLRGIQANPNASADDDSPGWIELAPGLARKPLQFDLLAQSEESCSANLLVPAAVPADLYRQIRLQISPDEPMTDPPALEQNACGESGFNCTVTENGDVHPIKVGGFPAVIRITSAEIEDGFFSVPPDSDRQLEITLSGYSLLSLPATQAPELVPTFTATLAPPCNAR